jgi:hypothetical protein
MSVLVGNNKNSITLSEEEDEEIGDLRCTGEFAFNPLGPANLKELDIEATLIA